MRLVLTAALVLLTLSAPAFADVVPEGIKPRATPPVGNGDPNDISCWALRTTPPIRGLRCARNWQWARINAGGSLPGFYGQSNIVPTNSGFSAVPNAGQHTPLP